MFTLDNESRRTTSTKMNRETTYLKRHKRSMFVATFVTCCLVQSLLPANVLASSKSSLTDQSSSISSVAASNTKDVDSVASNHQASSVSFGQPQLSEAVSRGTIEHSGNQATISELANVRSDEQQQQQASALNQNHAYNQYHYQTPTQVVSSIVNDLTSQQQQQQQQQQSNSLDMTHAHPHLTQDTHNNGKQTSSQIVYQKPIVASLSIASNVAPSNSDSLKPEPRNQYVDSATYMGTAQLPIIASSPSSLSVASLSNQQQIQQQQQQQQSQQQTQPQYNSWFSNPMNGAFDQSGPNAMPNSVSPSLSSSFNQAPQTSSVPSSSSYGPPSSSSNNQIMQQWNSQPQQSVNAALDAQTQSSPVQLNQAQSSNMQQQQQPQQTGQHQQQPQHMFSVLPGSPATASAQASGINPAQIQPVVPITNLSGRRSSLTGWLRGITGMLANIFNRRDHPSQLSAQSQANGQWTTLPNTPNWLSQANMQQQQQQQQYQQQRYHMPASNNMQSGSQQQQQQQLGSMQTGADLVASASASNNYPQQSPPPASSQQQAQQLPQQPLLAASNPWPARATNNGPQQSNQQQQSYSGLNSQKASPQSTSYQSNQQWTMQQQQSGLNSNSHAGNNPSKSLDQISSATSAAAAYLAPQPVVPPFAPYPPASQSVSNSPSSASMNNQPNNWSSSLSSSSPSSSVSPSSPTSSSSSSPASSSWSMAPSNQQQQSQLVSSIYPSSAYQRGSPMSQSDNSQQNGNSKLNSLIQSSPVSSSLPMGHYSRFAPSSVGQGPHVQAALNQSTFDRIPSTINDHRGFSQPALTSALTGPSPSSSSSASVSSSLTSSLESSSEPGTGQAESSALDEQLETRV